MYTNAHVRQRQKIRQLWSNHFSYAEALLAGLGTQGFPDSQPQEGDPVTTHDLLALRDYAKPYLSDIFCELCRLHFVTPTSEPDVYQLTLFGVQHLGRQQGRGPATITPAVEGKSAILCAERYTRLIQLDISKQAVYQLQLIGHSKSHYH